MRAAHDASSLCTLSLHRWASLFGDAHACAVAGPPRCGTETLTARVDVAVLRKTRILKNPNLIFDIYKKFILIQKIVRNWVSPITGDALSVGQKERPSVAVRQTYRRARGRRPTTRSGDSLGDQEHSGRRRPQTHFTLPSSISQPSDFKLLSFFFLSFFGNFKLLSYYL